MALALRKEEGFGLAIAIAAHLALVAVLLLRPHSAPVVQPPERIEVTISDQSALTSTSPEPRSQAAATIAPTLGEPQPQEQAEPAESEPEPTPPEPAPPQPAPPKPSSPKPTPPKPISPKPAPPKPTPVRPKPAPPKPAPPKPTPRPVPRKLERPTPKPTPRAPERLRETPRPSPAKSGNKPAAARPAAKPSPSKAPARTASPSAQKSTQKGKAKTPSKAPAKTTAPAGGSRIGADFLEGVSGAKPANRPSTGSPAATIGPAVRSSLASSISRQLKPRWQAPQGPDAQELVTILSFNLNRDGTLAGTPTVVRQLGINDTNRTQADRHAEQAIKAVRLAAPFDLPAEYYDAWKRVSQFRFDKRLSQ